MSQGQVLVVDLDGTLVNTDLFYESLFSILSKDLRSAVTALAGVFHGKARLKAILAERTVIDPSGLPYNEPVLAMIRAWRETGGRTALVTAADQHYANAIADHLGLFDEVFASDGSRNLKGRTKARFLADHYGAGHYAYAGDAQADLPVWQSAARAITVGAGQRLRHAVEGLSDDAQHIDAKAANVLDYLRALRPHQWLKNVLVFLPALAAHDSSAQTWGASLLAFMAFCLVSSSVYVLNDLLDLASDRAHPRKRNRPFASGAIPLAHGAIMAPALLIIGFLLALGVGSLAFLGVMLIYGVLTTAYSISLKRILVLDIVTLAGLYTLRIIAGGAATGITLSVWLLAFSIFIFLALAAVKRQAELVDGIASGRKDIAGRSYTFADLPIVSMMAIASGYVAVLVLALFLNSDAVTQVYSTPELLWALCPVLLYWISRMVIIAHNGGMHDDPIVFAVTDRASQICGVLVAATVVAGSFL